RPATPTARPESGASRGRSRPRWPARTRAARSRWRGRSTRRPPRRVRCRGWRARAARDAGPPGAARASRAIASSVLQCPRRGHDLRRRWEFPEAGRALARLDIGPLHDAVAVDQELALELRPLALHLGL